jgi:PAS domain-containing protein
MIRVFKKSYIAIVGGGKVCKSMLKILLSKHFAIHRPSIVAVADINESAEGIRYAKNKGIFTTRDFQELYSIDKLDLIIELTGNDKVLAKLQETKPPQVRLIDHFEAMSLWDYVQIEEKKLALKHKLKNGLTKPEALEDEFESFSRELGKIVEERTHHLQTAEKELVERERAFSQIVEATAIPTFVINENHTVTHWNKALEKLTNIQTLEIVGTDKQWMSFYSDKRPTMADFILDKGADEKEMRTYYGESLRKSAFVDGAYETENFWPELGESGKWFFTTAAPIRSPDGKIVGAIENILDITARKLLQQEREKQVRQLKALWAISSALSASLDLEESLQTAVGGILAHLDVDSAGIYLKADKTADFRVAYSSGYSEPFFQPGSKVGPDGIIGKVAQIDEPRFF